MSVVFVLAVLVIIVLSVVGAVVASAIVAENWRLIFYVGIAMGAMALIGAACRMVR